jgi:hypothetical protein
MSGVFAAGGPGGRMVADRSVKPSLSRRQSNHCHWKISFVASHYTQIRPGYSSLIRRITGRYGYFPRIYNGKEQIPVGIHYTLVQPLGRKPNMLYYNVLCKISADLQRKGAYFCRRSLHFFESSAKQ